MGKLVKLIGSGIGLASEAIAARKQSSQTNVNANADESSSSAAQQAPAINEPPPQYVEVSDSHAEELIASGKAVPADYKADHKVSAEHSEEDATSEEGDDEQWELDDAVGEHTPTEEEPAQDVNQLTDAFMRSHPPPAYAESVRRGGNLPCPVIIPQRRPRDKKRGFVRAYAPVLEDCGIDQATFLDFLKTFHAASKSSPWLTVVNIAAAGAGMAPSAIAMGVSIATQFAVGVAMEVQARTRYVESSCFDLYILTSSFRTNSFLDRINNEFFKARGLYCLIMTYKPESSDTHASVDITQAISSSTNLASSGMKQAFKNMRLSSGKTYGELEMPEAAPLIFPALDQLAATEEGVKKQNKLKSSQKFMADYFDRRAQATYAAQNPNSLLAQRPSAFASRYSDPNHPANSRSLVSLLTGGVLNPEGRRQERRSAKRINRAYWRGEPITPQTGKGREGLVKRMLKKVRPIVLIFLDQC
jgi:hypothetical protein